MSEAVPTVIDMTRRDDYEFWTLESIEQLNGRPATRSWATTAIAAQRKLRDATTAEERREALRLIDLAHEGAIDVVEARDAGGRSVRAFPVGFTGGR